MNSAADDEQQVLANGSTPMMMQSAVGVSAVADLLFSNDETAAAAGKSHDICSMVVSKSTTRI